MEKSIITILSVFSLSIIYTFLDDVDYLKKNRYINIYIFLIFLAGILSIDIIGLKIMIFLIYIKFLANAH